MIDAAMVITLCLIALLLLIGMVCVCLRPGSIFRKHCKALKTDPNSIHRLPELNLIFRSLTMWIMLSMASAVFTPAMAAKGGKAYRLAHVAAPKEQFDQAPLAPKASVADGFGQLYVQYNGRVTLMHALSVEFCKTLYGKESYKGLTADQVLSGFYYNNDVWRHEPITTISRGDTIHAHRCQQLINAASDGSLFLIVPSSQRGESWTTDIEELDRIGEMIANNDPISAFRAFMLLREHQEHFAPAGSLPSSHRMWGMEMLGNQPIMHGFAWFILGIGILGVLFFLTRIYQKRRLKTFQGLLLWVLMLVGFGALSAYLTLAWRLGGCFPVSSAALVLECGAWMSLLMGIVGGLRLYRHPVRGIVMSTFTFIAGILLQVAVLFSLAFNGVDQLPESLPLMHQLLLLVGVFTLVWMLVELAWSTIALSFRSWTKEVQPIFLHMAALGVYPMIWGIAVTLLFWFGETLL